MQLSFPEFSYIRWSDVILITVFSLFQKIYLLFSSSMIDFNRWKISIDNITELIMKPLSNIRGENRIISVKVVCYQNA